MLERIRVKSFEALHDVDLTLGRFTVILGDSSAGKSAFTRALHALVNNIRGNAHVTHGHKHATVITTLTNWIVTLERGEGRNVYRVTDRRTGEQLPPIEKLNKAVPERISEILDMSEANFAGQDDPPFLLKDSGSQVARVLGELTNVSTIFEAVQAGNKKRKALGTELKTRQADLENAQRELVKFQDLPGLLQAAGVVELEMAEVESLDDRYQKLNELIDQYTLADKILTHSVEYPEPPTTNTLEEVLDRRTLLATIIENLEEAETVLGCLPDYPDVPDLQDVLDLYERRQLLARLTDELTDAMVDLDIAKNLLNESDTLEEHYNRQIHDLLVEAGKCPTCNQKVS